MSVITEIGGSTLLVASSRRDSLSKVQESHRGENFKVAGHLWKPAIHCQLLRDIMDLKVELRKGIVADLNAIQANPLVGPRQVRRCIEAGTQPGCCQDRS
jgi:hypothetical protein